MLIAMLHSFKTRMTLGICAVIIFVLGAIASAAAQPARRMRKRHTQAIEWATFKEPMFLYFMAFNLLVSMSFRAPMAFGPDFSAMLGYDPKISSYLLAVVSGTGVFARPLLAWAADKAGYQNMLMLSMGLYALTSFAVWFPAAAFSCRALWIVFIVICGALNGGFLQLSENVARSVFGEEVYYFYSGAFLAIRGLGFVVGNPIGGALVRKDRDDRLDGPDFYRVIFFTGICLVVGTLCLAEVRRLNAKKGGWRWKS
jgi:MFS family permease